MSMLFISIFIIPSMEMYAVPTSNEQNLELSAVSGTIDSKEIETNFSSVQEELLHEMSDANVMKNSDISGISESLETIKLDQEHASSMSYLSYAALFIAGIFIGMVIGFLGHVVLIICATSQSDFQSMKTDLQPMETALQPMKTDFQSISSKVIFGLLLVIVIFWLIQLFFSVVLIVNC